ncbi:2-vinyl bacteriochlorophyllide hydratase [Pelagibius sp.]|uniref:2-vinyl bacteriochlorophyllide hydratase n=1 Tax=Pelagibius sp. TaxID=1931238 RepID=UPI0026142C05|nr:2-vinyl bacteriochlorophyllide hydratase [Pelagibius sp.]
MIFASGILDRCIAAVDFCPWPAHAAASPLQRRRAQTQRRALYTAEQRRRRDASRWTLVQGILAPLQFAVFLISLYLVMDYLATGQGYALATGSIILKTLVLYTIMITGSLWERDVFGRYLFAPAFFWEDVVSMLVLALHSAYLIALLGGLLAPRELMLLALAAYVSYVVNAAQFVLKLRAARREQQRSTEHLGLASLAK